ncbi:MAG: hypothetical protein WBK55_07030 [Alphaproteobacteria bacterium]
MSGEKEPGKSAPLTGSPETPAAAQPPATEGAQPAPPSQKNMGPIKPPPDNEFQGRQVSGKKKKSARKKPVKTQVEEQIDADLARSSIENKRKSGRRFRFNLGIVGGVILLLAFGVHWLLKPYEGGLAFGICRVFLEGITRYPDHLRLSTVEEFDNSVRIWYTQVDSFGEYRMEPIQCYYKNDPELGTIIDKVTINRREIDPGLIDHFNRALPSVLVYPMDLTIPAPLPDSLQDLQFETQKFRKPIL